MPRLTIEQIAAPNQSAAASLLAGAGASLDRGLSAASNLLATYEKGQQDKGDQAVLAEIANLNSEEELGKYLTSGALNDVNLSPGMQAEVLKLRDGILGANQKRANTDQTQVSTQIARAAEGRTSETFARGTAEYNRQTGQRDYLQDNAQGFLNAERSGLNNGSAFSGAIASTESGGGTDQYDTLFGHRNRQNGVKVSNMTIGQAKDFSSTSGEYAQSVNEEIGRVATPMGKFQIVGTTLRGIQEDLNLPDTVNFNPAVQELMGTYLGQKRVQGSQTAQSMRDGLRAEWEGFKNKSDAELDVIAAELRNQPPVSREQIIAASQGQTPQRGLGGDNFANQLAGSGLFTPGEILTTVDPLRQSAAQGDQLNEAVRANAVANNAAQTTIDALQSPGVTTAAGVASANLNNPNLSATERLAAATAGRGVAETNQDILAPETTLDPLVTAQIASDERTRQRSIDALPQTSLLKTAERYEGDAVGGLVNDLGIGADGEDPEQYVFDLFGEGADKNQLRLHIKNIAQESGVTEEVAAAAMADKFNRDPWGLNRNGKRFNPDEIVQYINETVGPDAIQAYEGELVKRDTANARAQAATLEIQTLQTQLTKATGQRKIQIQDRIKRLTDQTLVGVTPQQAVTRLESYVRGKPGMAARLREARAALQADPESTEAFRAISDLETEIQGDGDLSDKEKELLISTMSG